MPARTGYDVVVVGGGHNGLVAATLLARAGRSVLVLEQAEHVGGAAVSTRVFPGHDARLSRYSYLVSLLPAALVEELGLRFATRRRRISSYTPHGDGGLLIESADPRPALRALTGSDAEGHAWSAFYTGTQRVAAALFPTLLEPLREEAELRDRAGENALWDALVHRPLGETLEARFADDLVRGVVLTDALIGTFASAHDPGLAQNRCFLYHVIGNGTGDWDVPIGGMGALTDELARVAREAGAELVTGARVTAIAADGEHAEVTWAPTAGGAAAGGGGPAARAASASGSVGPAAGGASASGSDGPASSGGAAGADPAAGGTVAARDVLCGAAPSVLARLLGDPAPPAPEGAQLKVNLLLDRLPRLRDAGVDPVDAFSGTFHVAEGYGALEQAYREAAGGAIPTAPPSEIYCHSLTDPTILGDAERAAGRHTLTLFGLHMPARLFTDDPGARDQALAATLATLDEHLAEPIAGCLARDADGRPCVDVASPVDLEAALGLPAGHIFHRDLQWPWADAEHPAGTWGVETARPNVWLCGAGARRGGGVSGVPGHNAARALLERG